MVELSRSLLNHGDARNFRQPLNRGNLDLFAGPPWDVVNTNRNLDRLGDCLEVLKETFLGRFVVIGRYLQGRVRTLGRGSFCQTQGFGGAVASRSGHHFGTPRDTLNHLRNDSFVLIVRERRRLTSRPRGDDALSPRCDLEFDLLSQTTIIDGTISKRSNDRDGQTREVGTLAYRHRFSLSAEGRYR